MVVRAHDKHPGRSGSVGLHVGTVNAQQYFPRNLRHVELELDHLRIVCSLDPSFWLDRPEIYDQRLSSWLECKRNSGKMASQDAPVAMIPCGKSAFRLQIVTKDEADRSLAGPLSSKYFSPNVSPVALLDRRKHKLVPAVERRRVDKLKADDRTSAAANN
jgi:hypothetical protein